MIYFKKHTNNGVMIGIQESLPDNSVEITESEYSVIYNEIREEAIRKAKEELELSLLEDEEGGDNIEHV